MDVAEPEILVETREDLLYMLAEAAEIEHNLMCCYLYAAFSLKRGAGHGFTPEQARAVERWRGVLVSVAIEEMAHLALVANVTVALGGAPHLARPNLPIAPGYHPSGVVAELARFCIETLDHFIYLERPEGDVTPDSDAFRPELRYLRGRPAGRLMPSAQDYATVGHLYRALDHGLEVLAARLGEAALLCGNPAAQVAPPEMQLPGLMRVADLATARQAIQTIVEQGEGAPGHRDDSHFVRFRAIRDEFVAMTAADPNFQPAWPAARNPVMRRPVAPAGRVWITDPHAALVLDLANALYNHMLRCLASAYGRTAAEAAWRNRLLDAAIALMTEMGPIAEYLAGLPAGPEHPGLNAGITFTMLREIGRLQAGAGEGRVLGERLAEMAAQAGRVFPAGHALSGVAGRLQRLADGFVSGAGTAPLSATPIPAAIPAGAIQEERMSTAAMPGATGEAPPKVPAPEVVEGAHLTLRFDGQRCIHARFCVLGAPDVFKANTPGAWIFPDSMPVEALVAVANNCPSGAITYARKDSGANEAAPPVNTIHIRENGPLAFHAPMTLGGEDIGYRATLCRCGQSKNKPFCDGSHVAAGFQASGEPATRKSEPLAVRNGTVEVAPRPNGPLVVSGNLEICAGTGRTVDRVSRAALCRCGASNDKPFCDGSHNRIGFQAP